MAPRLRKKSDGKLSVRLRFGDGQDSWFDLNVDPEATDVAEDRRKRLQRLANLLKAAGKIAESRAVLEQAASERSEKAFRLIEAAVEGFSPETTPEKARPTFRKIAQDLCDGILHDLHPDDVPYRTQEGREARRTMLAAFFPVLGDKTFDQITRDDLDEAKRLIPRDIKQNTRGRYLRELRFLMNLAVEPLRLVEHVPLVKVPRQVDTDQFQLFYPEEEEKVAGATIAVSLEERFLYAFLCRCGGRITETLQYTWERCDLERGQMRVAKEWTKTGKARRFDFEPDVLEALRLRRAMIPDAALIFTPPPERIFNRTTVYQHLHQNLRAAGLTRPELFEAPEGERALTTHDFRASFITLARALGMSDTWIRDRTGHEDPKTLMRYDRDARHAIQHQLGWWAPMGRALKMPGATVRTRLGLSLVPNVGQGWAKTPQTPAKPGVDPFRVELIDTPPRGENQRNIAPGPLSREASDPRGPAGKPHVGQEGLTDPSPSGPSPSGTQDTPGSAPVGEDAPGSSPVERALAAALPQAMAAGQYDLAQAIVLELGERRRARLSTKVTSLADARAKREKGEGK